MSAAHIIEAVMLFGLAVIFLVVCPIVIINDTMDAMKWHRRARRLDADAERIWRMFYGQ